MITQCAWCGHVLGQSGPAEDKRITHTICLPCFESTCEALEPEREKSVAISDRLMVIPSRKVA
jgi:hypothetical protein